MSRKKRKTSASKAAASSSSSGGLASTLKSHWQQFSNAPVDKKRRTLFKSAAAVGLAVTGGVALSKYDTQNKTLHDLTVVGQGEPVIVQIHDPSCPLCRRLKSATEKALESHPEVHYRLADVTTSEGRALQQKYDMPNVTLLFFNGKGRHIHTLQGVRPVEEVLAAIESQFDLEAKVPS